MPFLSPTIQAAIVEGRQPTSLTAKHLLRRNLPLDWAEQERIFGFAG